MTGRKDLVVRLGALVDLYYLWWPLHEGYLARWWDGAGLEVDLLRSRQFRQSDIDLDGIHAGYIPIEAGLAAAWSVAVDDRLWVPLCRILDARESLTRELAAFGSRSTQIGRAPVAALEELLPRAWEVEEIES